MSTTVELSGRELDAAVAEEVCGWRWAVYLRDAYLLSPDQWEFNFETHSWPNLGMGWSSDVAADCDRRIEGWPLGCVDPVPTYSADLNACAEVEAEIARRGLQTEYVDTLLYLTERATQFPPFDHAHLFALATATPEQRCRAALAAVRGETK